MAESQRGTRKAVCPFRPLVPPIHFMTLRFLEDFTIFSASKSSRKLIGYLPVKNIFVEKNRNILGQIYMQFSLVDQRRETRISFRPLHPVPSQELKGQNDWLLVWHTACLS